MWCRTVRVLAADGQIGGIDLLRILKSLRDQLAYLEIVTVGHAGNWPTIGMGGMVECVAVFPMLRDHDRFVDYCIGEFGKQIADQVLPDGVQDELTPHYHRVVVGNILSTQRSLLTSERSYYPYLRSTAAHSTLRIDGQDQNSRSRPDLWISKQPLAMGWAETDGEVRASGAYELGYGPKNEIRAVHRREIVFVREKCWVIFDVVEGSGEHVIESQFQFAAGTVRTTADGARTEFPDANLLLVARPTAPFADARIESGQENPRREWYSDAYNKIEPAPALSQSLKTALPWRSATLLLPYKGARAPRVDFRHVGRSATIRCDVLGAEGVRVECRLP